MKKQVVSLFSSGGRPVFIVIFQDSFSQIHPFFALLNYPAYFVFLHLNICNRQMC